MTTEYPPAPSCHFICMCRKALKKEDLTTMDQLLLFNKLYMKWPVFCSLAKEKKRYLAIVTIQFTYVLKA